MASITKLSPVTVLPLVTFLASAWLTAGIFYNDLPTRIPSHWGVLFKADGFTPKPWGVFTLPIVMTVIWVTRPIFRRISLPSQRHERFPGAFDFRIMLTVGFLFVLWMSVLLQAAPWTHVLAVPIAVALIVACGYFMTRPSNTRSAADS